MLNKIYNIVVTGRVQRVGYRGWALDLANRLGLYGWVKNLRNGNVELLIVGNEESTNEMIKGCVLGPARARVDNIVVNEIKTNSYDNIDEVFKIL